MNEHELPDDLRQLESLYQSPEEHIQQLEQAILFQNKKIVQLTEERDLWKEKYIRALKNIGNLNQPNY